MAVSKHYGKFSISRFPEDRFRRRSIFSAEGSSGNAVILKAVGSRNERRNERKRARRAQKSAFA